MLLPLNPIKPIKSLLGASKPCRHTEGFRYPAGQNDNTVLVRLFTQKVEDWVGGVLLIVVPVFDPGEVGAGEVSDDNGAQQNAAELCAFPAECPNKNQSHQSGGQNKEQ